MDRKLSLEVVETTEELKELLREQKDARLKERVQALYLLKTHQVTELKGLAQVVGRDTSTLYRWCERYRKGGLAGLLALGYANGGRPAALPEGVQAALWKRLQAPEGCASYGAIQQWLQEEYGLAVKYKTVHRIVRYQLKGKLKVPRPSSIHRDMAAGVEFKTDLPRQRPEG
jgi:transposase